MELWVGVGLGLLVAIVALLVWWVKAHASRVNDCFRAAVEVYVFSGDQRVRLAAVTAAKVAAGEQRASMVRYLRAMRQDMATAPLDGRVTTETQERLADLEREISSRDWTRAEVFAAKAELGAAAPEYLTAIERADPGAFRSVPIARSSFTPKDPVKQNAMLQELADDARRQGVSLQEVVSMPTRAMEIVGTYGRLLEHAPAQVRPESTLPYPKQVIEKALQMALSSLSDAGSQRALETALLELDAFVPDHEVPQDPSERALGRHRREQRSATTDPRVRLKILKPARWCTINP